MNAALDDNLDRPLRGLLVGISISDPAVSELEDNGLRKAHLDRTFLDLATHLLAAGASLAYGGDLRLGGFTRRLVELLQVYSDDRPGRERIRLFLQRQTWEAADEDTRADVSLCATTELIEPVDAASGDLAAAAQSLDRMRERMNEAIHARVVLGGKLVDFSGRYPGIAQEAWLAAQRGTPLYVLGGFGGCGGRLADALLGGDPEELTLEYQLAHHAGYGDRLRQLGKVDYNGLRDTFRRLGPGGLRNGLAEDHSAQLARSSALNFVVPSVLTGLLAVARDRGPS